MSLPESVDAVVTEYLHRLDSRLPNVVDSLHLTGSLALEAFQPGHSDIDFTAVVRRPLSTDQITVLTDIHAGLPSQPMMDGQYATVSLLRRQPGADRQFLRVSDGRFDRVDTDTDTNTVPTILLHELQCHAITLRGDDPTAQGIGVDAAELRRWLRDNLTDYWAPLAHQLHSQLADRLDDEPVNPETLVWSMSGPQRLHYTLNTGRILSKTAALRYALDRFDHVDRDLVDRCIAWRDGGDATFTVADGRQAAVHIERVVSDAFASPTE
ncbi:hypothetical protein FB566_4734 [Stackebrandtia endophytica]|uniref:Nucleotidyltransferase-like protein n=1 Tax=Stackebrandtia endophytica TaxID=1496996 RepID=A0A543B2R8_9ACTN|nr:hypothetical protein [Stackebrandtia endophytica]TQL79133.1 hypothetical protein FB566_4734 [Stackebrandtia endophytica]